jgi:hypothetical protein
VSPVKYEQWFYIPEDDILHSHRREISNLTSRSFTSKMIEQFSSSCRGEKLVLDARTDVWHVAAPGATYTEVRRVSGNRPKRMIDGANFRT